MRPRITAAFTLLSILAAPAAVTAQSYRVYGAEQFFSVEWAASVARGRPLVSGYVVNKYGLTARQMRVLVESLDASGAVTGATIGYVNADVPPDSRRYFEVPLRVPAASYRVSVLSWDWKMGHGM